MSADFTKPTVLSTKANWPTEIQENTIALAKMLSDETSMPAEYIGAKRWSKTKKIMEQWNGTEFIEVGSDRPFTTRGSQNLVAGGISGDELNGNCYEFACASQINADVGTTTLYYHVNEVKDNGTLRGVRSDIDGADGAACTTTIRYKPFVNTKGVPVIIATPALSGRVLYFRLNGTVYTDIIDGSWYSITHLRGYVLVSYSSPDERYLIDDTITIRLGSSETPITKIGFDIEPADSGDTFAYKTQGWHVRKIT